MSQPYVGEIRMFNFNFAPAGWTFCEGQLLPISENEVLFNVIGTTYGGDGQSTFALPDLRGRIPIHFGNGYVLGETGGEEKVALTVNQNPAHSHQTLASMEAGNANSPSNRVLGTTPSALYRAYGPPVNPMHAQSIDSVGGGQPHDNMPPYRTVHFIISLFGIFPS